MSLILNLLRPYRWLVAGIFGVLLMQIAMSAEETAEAVGSTPGAVRVAQHRALARLKAEIIATRHNHA